MLIYYLLLVVFFLYLVYIHTWKSVVWFVFITSSWQAEYKYFSNRTLDLISRLLQSNTDILGPKAEKLWTWISCMKNDAHLWIYSPQTKTQNSLVFGQQGVSRALFIFAFWRYLHLTGVLQGILPHQWLVTYFKDSEIWKL